VQKQPPDIQLSQNGFSGVYNLPQRGAISVCMARRGCIPHWSSVNACLQCSWRHHCCNLKERGQLDADNCMAHHACSARALGRGIRSSLRSAIMIRGRRRDCCAHSTLPETARLWLCSAVMRWRASCQRISLATTRRFMEKILSESGMPASGRRKRLRCSTAVGNLLARDLFPVARVCGVPAI